VNLALADAAEAAQSHLWDVVVVGTGAGGATAGFALARAGKSVLFLERGKLLDRDPTVVRGEPFSWNDDANDALRHGWWPDHLYRRDGGADVGSYVPLGSGTGGSTSLFGMVMDRLRPEDFTPRRCHPTATAASLPEAWPIDYADLDPFYQQAERMYRVRGTADPLTKFGGALLEPPPPTEKETVISGALTRAGLHPYRIHYAQDRKPECTVCPALLCPLDCRNDAAKICMRPAIEEHGARVLAECAVVRLEEEGREVRRAICDWNGQRIAVRGKTFLLAAGAFLTPTLLQRSANARFPGGLANSSGLVGRNLMLHASDFLLLRLKGASFALGALMHHGLSLNDFYIREGTKLGNVHAHPVAVGRDAILAFLRLHKKWVNRIPSPALSMIGSVAAYLHRSSTTFATVLEDLPYVENRVFVKPGTDGRVTYEYHYPEELGVRSAMLYKAFKRAVGGLFDVRPLRPIGMLNYGHVCGTCRFGDDPSASVLDRDNRAHDLDNLYIVDASFFPSSGGINPSLTIVANSLRVSEKIARRL
jgi:choline dehydrogenase-like flavoprotein